AAAAGGLEQLPRGASADALVLGVLEGRAEGLDPGGLGLVAALAHRGHRRPDPHRVAGSEPEGSASDDLLGAEVGAAVGEAEILGGPAVAAGGRADVDP